ncbi:MAG: SIR2 family protein [Bacteroidales bacterium]|nr:SIR2 family protein [Bacteroidales bacterium]
MKKIVLIIGNGFDLDLGLKTRYIDFVNSKRYWPQGEQIQKNVYRKQGLLAFLNDKAKSDNWFDLERSLKEFATSTSEYLDFKYNRYNGKDESIQLFNELTRKLSLFIKKREKNDKLKNRSFASYVISKCMYFNKIYTFNYTDINHLAERLGYSTSCNVVHIHGSIKENSIILGVDGGSTLLPDYGFLRKTISKNYKSNYLNRDLKDADEVIFFGFSFSKIDFGYFSEFFNSLLEQEKRKTIIVITKDNDSIYDIKSRIEDEGISLSRLYEKTDFRCYAVSDKLDYDEVLQFK